MKKPSPYIALAVLTPAILFGGIAGAKALGWWRTSGGGSAPALIAAGGFAGMYDPADIRGSSSFASIEGFFGIPAAVLAQAFGFAADAPGLITAKAVDELYGELHGLNGEERDVGTDAVKLFVARMTGLPYTPEANTGMPEDAIELILTLGTGMDETTRSDLLSRAVAMRRVDESPVSQAAEASQAAPVAQAASQSAGSATGQGSGAAAAPASAGLSFSGRTSFGEVMAAGLTKAQIESVLGRAMPPQATSVKDFCESNGLAYSQVRNALQALLGQ